MGRRESGSRIEYIPELGLLGEIEFETQPSKDDSIFFKVFFFQEAWSHDVAQAGINSWAQVILLSQYPK